MPIVATAISGTPNRFIALDQERLTRRAQLIRITGWRISSVPGDREMVDIVALVLQHDEQAALSALKAGVPTSAPVPAKRG
jgi:hypothetical protein